MENRALAEEILQKISIIHNIPEFKVLYSFNKGEMRLLFVLKEGPLTPGEICSKLQISSALAAKLIRQLCFKGLVKRNINLHDRRSITVAITPKGEEAVNEAYDHLVEELSALMEGLGQDDSLKGLAILEKLISLYEGRGQDND